MSAKYDQDFAAWAFDTAAALREGRLIDAENVAEEIETLGRSEHRAVRSHLTRLMMHKVKQRIQPERDGPSWQQSIREARKALLELLGESPSLRPYLEENKQKWYTEAVEEAIFETQLYDHSPLPRTCPWDLDFLLAS